MSVNVAEGIATALLGDADNECLDDILATMAESQAGLFNLLKGLLMDDHSDDPYGIPMAKMAVVVLMLQACKDEQYGRSWAKRGELGVYHNIMRKEDRLDEIMLATSLQRAGSSIDGQTSVALIDTLIDRAAYSMMWASLIAKTHPEDFLSWMNQVWCNATSIPIEVISEFLGMECPSE